MAATSRHGLFSLFSGDKPLLSCHDLNIVYCVNPEESVGRALFKQIMVSLLQFLSRHPTIHFSKAVQVASVVSMLCIV